MQLQNYIVTGATGFLGSNLVKRLLKDNCQVNVIVRDKSRLGLIGHIADQLNIFEYRGEIDQLVKWCKELEEVEATFHLAACTFSKYEAQDVSELINSNITFGTQLLEALTICKCKKFINTSTYWQHYNEEQYNPVDLYAATKEAFEKIIDYYVQDRNIAAITLEIFDNYGINDNRKKIMNLLKNAYISKQKLDMTQGEQLIDLLYVDDVIGGYIVAANTQIDNKSHDKYMVKSNYAVTLRELVSVFEEVIGESLNISFGKRPYKNREIMKPWDKGVMLPNWTPKLTLEQGIKIFIQ